MSGSLKISLSMMKRIGRGLAAISSTASMKLTWLQTRSAAPCGRDVLVAAHLEAIDEAGHDEGDEAEQVLRHQHEDVERDDRVEDADDEEHLRDRQAGAEQGARR